MEEKAAGKFIKSYGKYIFILLLLMVAAYSLLYLTYQNVKQEMIDGLNARQMINAKQAARGIEYFFSDHINILRNYSKNEHIITLDESGKSLMREFLLSRGAEISIITRVDSRGRIVHPEPYDRKVVGQTVTNMDDFLQARNTRQITVSDVFTTRRGYQSIIVHAPVFKNGHFNGTIALLLSFDFITKRYIQDIRIGNDGYAWIVSRKGIELSCPVPGHVGNSVFDNCRAFPDILTMAKRMTKGEQGVTTYLFDRVRGNTVSTTTKHAVFMPIRLGNTFWSIVIATPEDEVTGSLNQFRNRLLLIAVILIIGIGFFLYILIKTRMVAQEVERRRKTEEALRKSEENYRLLFENAAEGILLIQGDMIKFANPALAEILGYPRDVITTRTFPSFLHPDDRAMIVDRHVRRMRGEPMETGYRFRIITADETVRWLHIFSRFISWEGMPASLSFVMDITDHRQVEEALRESERKYQSLFYNAEVALFRTRISDGKLLEINERYAQMAGYADIKECIAEFNSADAWADPRGREELVKIIREKGSVRDYETEIIRRDGTHISISFSATIFPEQNYLQGSIVDITDHKRAEEENRLLEERLNRAEKMEALGTLAGGVAHDLNNVLGVIVGYAELALDDVDKVSPLRRHLEKVMGGGLKAAAIVNDLLTLARRGVVGSDVLNLNKIIIDCERSPEMEKLHSYHPSVKFRTDIDKDLLNIAGSSIHLSKSLYNLLSNAAEAMPQGGSVTIKTTNQYLDKPVSGYDNIREGDYVVLSVSDSGEGISADNLQHIFEPFYTKKVMGRSGTGLGLAVVWGTVKDHHGYINVESQLGKGSTFTLYFPVTRKGLTAQALAAEVSAYIGNGESILIVDDVKEQRDLAAGMLRTLNYSVATVAGGEEAVAYVKEHEIDLIVLDMIMDPGMDGLDTYKSILGIHPQQKAIIVSGYSESERVKEAEGLGAGAYVRKPYIKEKLGLAVRKELDRKQTPAETYDDMK